MCSVALLNGAFASPPNVVLFFVAIASVLFAQLLSQLLVSFCFVRSFAAVEWLFCVYGSLRIPRRR